MKIEVNAEEADGYIAALERRFTVKARIEWNDGCVDYHYHTFEQLYLSGDAAEQDMIAFLVAEGII